MKKVNAAEYLNNVLKSWERFCKTHRLIAESIGEILKEKASLKREIQELKSNIN